MADMNNIDPNNQAPAEQGKSANNRRSFLKKAAIGAPLITTVTSTSVFALGRASISGNLSGNTSHTHEESKVDGCSPGYYHKHESGHVNRGSAIRNTPLLFSAIFSDYLSSSYSSSANCNDSLEVVLNPKLWGSSSSATQLHRMAITALLNTYEFPTKFPYSSQQIVDFYSTIGDTVGELEAYTIFQNLIHGGESEHSWASSDDAICGS